MKTKTLFKQYFNLCLDDYLDPILGFDIVKFDDFLKIPNGISARDYITKQYGLEATLLIKDLLYQDFLTLTKD